MSDDNEFNEGGTGIADLRKHYENLKKELDAERAELQTFRQRDRQQTVAELLKAKGVPEGAAKFYSGDDVSEDAVGKWAEENATLFGGQPAQTAQTDANTQSAQRIASATYGSVSAPAPDASGRVLGDPEAIQHAIDTLPYDELVKLGYMPKIDGRLYRR